MTATEDIVATNPFERRPPTVEAERAVATRKGGCASLSLPLRSESLTKLTPANSLPQSSTPLTKLIPVKASAVHKVIAELDLTPPSPLTKTSAGRVANCLPNWKKLTLDPYILGQVQGIKLEFHTMPSQTKAPT